MAEYVEQARSNYFLVVDKEDFRSAMAHFDGVDVRDSHTDDTVTLIMYNGVPSLHEVDEGDGEWVETDFPAVVAQHLQRGSTVVIQQVGMEKMRYIRGFALAFDSTGATVEVDLDEIYDRAVEAGLSKPTVAAY